VGTINRPMVSWRLYLVGYLVWLIVFTVVEGAARQACRVPTARWIAAAADARDRTARTWFRDRADECLGYTRWYRYSIAGLLVIALAAPFAAVRALRTRRRMALLFAAVAGSLALTLGTMAGVRWLYDWYA